MFQKIQVRFLEGQVTVTRPRLLGYESYIRTHGNVWTPCWSHIRRKFFEAEMGDPVLRTWVLEQIKKLFEIEETAWTLPPTERLQLRQTDWLRLYSSSSPKLHPPFFFSRVTF